jgi:hypothetical protein
VASLRADPILAALHADAETARAEIRTAAIVCPSCGVNAADLPDGHMLVIYADADTGWSAECRDGAVVTLAAAVPMSDGEFKSWQDAGNVSLLDNFRWRETQAFSQMTGFG